MDVSFGSLALVAAVATAAPLALALSGIALPAIVAEILLGVAIGPHGLGWAELDGGVAVLATVGLAFLLLLAGLELDLAALRGRLLRIAAGAWIASFAVAAALGLVLREAGLVDSPLLLATILSATGLGVILPLLVDARQTGTPIGRAVVAGASIAEVAPIVLLSVLFSSEGGGTGSRLVLLGAFLVLVAALVAVLLGAQRWMRLSTTLLRLQDTTAEIRVRGTLLLLLGLCLLADRFGLEAILGAFLAGAALTVVDRDREMTHAFFHGKLRAAGFGVFVPFFFVATGMRLDIGSLARPATLALVPVFVAALLAVRALPALAYRPFATRPAELAAAGLLQATSLSIPVVAGQIGVELELIPPATYAALVAAGLVSVVVFPAISLRLLGARTPREADPPTAPQPIGG